MSTYEKVRDFLLELEHDITHQDEAESLFIISDEDKGLCNMMLDCEGDVIVIEQHIFDVNDNNTDVYKRLLQINREMVHGAFVLDEDGKRVMFRDTLESDNLDLNELEASLTALAITLVEHADEFISYASKEKEAA